MCCPKFISALEKLKETFNRIGNSIFKIEKKVAPTKYGRE
jgi:hypothetical protein